jgi:hypothetical protein
MGELGPFLVPITLFITIGAVAIFRGPLGKALGERIAGRHDDVAAAPEIDQLRSELDEIRYRLTDMEERLDFTERVLTQERDRGALPGAEET